MPFMRFFISRIRPIRPIQLISLIGVIGLICFFGGAKKAEAISLRNTSNNLGLLGYWKLDDATSTKATDFSGYGNTGTLTNFALTGTTSNWVTGKKSGGLSFDGTNDYIAVSSISSAALGGGFTWAAWVKSTNTAGSWMWPFGTSTGNWLQCGKKSGSGDVRFDGASGIYSGSELDTSGENIANGQWRHLVCIWNGSNRYIYIDGVLKASMASTAGGSPSSYGTMYVGAHPGPAEFWDGQLDDVRIYNRGLSATEVYNMYNEGVGRVNAPTQTGLVGLWNFDEATSTKAGDSSGYGNTGTLTNFASPSTATSGWNNGRRGGALAFDGTNDYVGGSGINISNSAFTISAWVNSATYSSDNQFFSLGSVGANDQSIHLRFTSATGFRFGMYNDDLDATLNAYANRWTLVTVTLDSSKLQTIYQDGVAKSSRTASSLFTGNTSWSIGRWVAQNSEFFNGSIDDVRVYNRALSAIEVADLYAKTSVGATRITTVSRNGLVGYWNFDDGTSTKATDFSGSGNTGTLTNGPTWTTGKRGKAVSFDGSDDYMDMGTSSNLSPSSLTVSAWAKIVGTGGINPNMIVNRQNGAAGYRLDYDTSVNKIEFTIWDSGGTNLTAITTSAISTNTWYHLVGTFNGSGSKLILYLNGVQQTDSVTANNPISTPSIPFTIGSYAGGQTTYNFKGSIDDVRIYNRALSAAEVQTLYNQGK